MTKSPPDEFFFESDEDFGDMPDLEVNVKAKTGDM